MESKSVTKVKFLEKFRADNPYPVPVDIDLPPLNIKFSLYNAIVDSKTAQNELIVKEILLPRQDLDKAYKWADIEKRKNNLRRAFQQSNKTIQDNKASLSRFLEIIREKSADSMNLAEQMAEVMADIADFKNVHEEMESYVDVYSMFETFLRDVVHASPDLNSVGDILNHYETLEHTRGECARLLKEGLDEATHLRGVMTKVVTQKTNRLKELRNTLTTMQVRRKQASERLKYWEYTLEKINQQIKSNERERVTLGGACYDLYRDMCKRRGVHATAAVRDIDSQTDFIMKTIAFYKEVITKTSARLARENPDEKV